MDDRWLRDDRQIDEYIDSWVFEHLISSWWYCFKRLWGFRKWHLDDKFTLCGTYGVDWPIFQSKFLSASEQPTLCHHTCHLQCHSCKLFLLPDFPGPQDLYLNLSHAQQFSHSTNTVTGVEVECSLKIFMPKYLENIYSAEVHARKLRSCTIISTHSHRLAWELSQSESIQNSLSPHVIIASIYIAFGKS